MRVAVTNWGQLQRGEGKTVPVQTRKAYEDVEEKLHAFLISSLQLNCQLHVPDALTQYPSITRLNAPHETVLYSGYLCMVFVSHKHTSLMASFFHTNSSFNTAAGYVHEI